MLFPRKAPQLLSIIIPMYNEEEVLPLLQNSMEKLSAELKPDVEIIFVDDGSRDKTLELAWAWAKKNDRVKLIALSRNFGHQVALTAGLDAASGDAVVILDADLQDPPELIPEMIKYYCEGYDVVYGQRTERRGESTLKIMTANMFYWTMKKFFLPDLPVNAGDFRLVSREVLDDLNSIRESGRFMRGLTTWVGYQQKAIPYTRSPRAAGSTKYPFMKMLRFASDAVYSFSDLPLTVISWIGMASIIASLILILKAFYMFFTGDKHLVVGWASLSVMISFFSGVILLSLGVMGKYIGRIYTETKRRPLYFVRKKINFKDDE